MEDSQGQGAPEGATQDPNEGLPSRHAAYQDLFDRLLDATFLIHPETYEILELNPAAERIFGAEEMKEMIGRNVVDLVEAPFREDFIKALRVSMRRYHPRQFEAQWIVLDPEKPGACKMVIVEIVACPLKLNDGSEVLQVIARDITARREAERKLKEMNEKLEILSTHDEMTKIHNFRFFKNALASEHERSLRFKTPYTVIFCDIDNFKHYNDRNGHPAGDALLREMATVLKSCARTTDLVARYGGEEFVVLCPQIDWTQAIVLAQRIKAVVNKHPFVHAEAQPLKCISFSIGVASFMADGSTPEEVLHSADQAMYYAKTHGRNQVMSHFRYLELIKSDPAAQAAAQAHAAKKAA